MKKQLSVLFVSASAAILLATLAVVKGYASAEAVSLSTMAAFGAAAGSLLWWNSNHKRAARTEESIKTRSAFIWLLLPFMASAVVAVVEALYEKWDIGETIGLAFCVLFVTLLIFEALRRKQKRTSQ